MRHWWFPVVLAGCTKLSGADGLDAVNLADAAASPSPSPTTTLPSSPTLNGPPDAGVDAVSDAGADVVTTTRSTRWNGSLATTATVDFGPPVYCPYSVRFADVKVALSLDEQGRPTSSTLTGTMVETVQNCEFPPKGSLAHTYIFAPTGEPTAQLTLTYAAAAGNDPRAELVLTGTRDGNVIHAHLRWHRNDIATPLDWTVEGDVDLVLSP